MIYNPNHTQVDRLPIGNRGDNTDSSFGNRDGGDFQETDRSEAYKIKNRKHRAIAQGIARSFGGSNQKELKKALSEGRAITDNTNKMDGGDIEVLIGVSLFFDGLSFVVCLLDFVIPLLGTIVEKITVFPVAMLTQYIMYKKRGVTFGAKILKRWWGSKIVEVIPYLNILPSYTIGTVLVILCVKTEEVTGLKKITDNHPEVLKYLEKYLK